METLARLREQGKIRHVGLSNVTLEHVERARKIVPIVSVQNRYSFADREWDFLAEPLRAEGNCVHSLGAAGAESAGSPGAGNSRKRAGRNFAPVGAGVASAPLQHNPADSRNIATPCPSCESRYSGA
jgi:aryl-alcohol dehydrogenase-like predicted oxidoreductase